jgi:SAM-dependent methyltransferase
MDQEEIVNQNRIAWESQSYDAWVCAYGTPALAAARLIRDPRHKIRRILPYLKNPENRKIANPLGSHGRVATSLALLGADVTVFDISATNRRYALELAESAGVRIQYELGDFIKLAKQHGNQYEYVVMELGVLHYFSDLNIFVRALATILQPKGVVVLNEFHPILKKSIAIAEDGITLTGDYFSNDLETAETPFAAFINDQIVPLCLVRRWNLGEIVTAFADCGFRLNKLIEEPSSDMEQLPGTFTLVAAVE